MEEAVVGAVVGATIQVVIQNLISVPMKEIKLVRDFKKDLEKLRKILDMIQDFLYEAEMQHVTDRAVKRWLKKLEDVAFEADNVLDEFHYHLLRKDTKKHSKTTMKKKLKSIISGSSFRGHRLKLGHKIRDINKELEQLNKEANSFGLPMRLAGPHAPATGSADASFVGLETDSFTVDAIFLGRDDDVSKIVEMLTRSPTDQVFSVLPVVGMGGLGKTTLTRKVFNNKKIKTHFGEHSWVYVSRKFDSVSLLKKILTNLTSGNDQVGSREVILKKLQEALRDKTYLLVLDDVWNQEQNKWDDFINSLSGITSIKGNAIIVTTRNTMVASIVRTLPIYELEALPEESCWSIIKQKAFGEGEIPLEYETIGRKIAKRCQGLPLAANVFGGVLRGKSKDEWLSIEQTQLPVSGGDESNIQRILKLSFDNLPSPSLKKCFAYCSIFPKGTDISRQCLIELWMAEGFLQSDQRNDMETVGNKFFNLLLQNCLLQVAWRNDYYSKKAYGMHEFVHNLACSILGPSKVDDNISNGIYQVRYIGCSFLGDESGPISKEKAKCLRTLFFKGKISDSMFSYFKCLHVLTLTGHHIEELPNSITELIHLRYLDTSSTRIRYFSDSIGELYHLQTLYVYKSMPKLPSTLKYLNALRHLHIHPFTELPPEIGKLTSLQTLPCFKVGQEKGHGIAELGSLRNLKGELEIRNLEKVRDKEEAKRACLFQKPNLEELNFTWNGPTEGETNDENVLEGLQPHLNLKGLRINGFRGENFPLWNLKMAVRDEIEDRWVQLKNLIHVTLSRCKRCETIPMLGHLPHLESIYLFKLTNVRSITSSFYGIENFNSNNGGCRETIIVFPALKRLQLQNLPNLTNWAELEISSAPETQSHEVKIFPCLEYLGIKNCEKLTSSPTHFPCLKNLDVCGIDSSLLLALKKLTSLTTLSIWKIDGLVCLPDGLFYHNQNLSELKIVSCPNLIELPDGLHTLSSLEELKIEGCPNLKAIPYEGQSQGLTFLRSLRICECEGLINWPYQMLESSAPWLESLSLRRLSRATNYYPMVIDCLQKMLRLTILEIEIDVLQFSSSPIGNLCNVLHSLQELRIDPSPDSSNCGSFNKIVDSIFRECHSLRRLTLTGMRHWESLPCQLQHLTTLSWLELIDFGIETLPEWVGNLSSLWMLKLHECKKLRRMPSKETMQRLIRLFQLDIRNCPLLKQRCIEQQNDEDSDWPNISHIPYVWVDGEEIPSHHQ